MNVDEIKIINVDNVPYVVEALPPQIKNLVSLYNEWNIENVHLRNELIKLDIAMKGMAQSIILAIRAEKEKPTEAAAGTPPNGLDATAPVMPDAAPPMNDVIGVTEESLAP